MAVAVCGINPKTTHEILELFFENPRKCGGGEIKEMLFDKDKQTAIIWFMDENVSRRCQEFCATSNIALEDYRLTVDIYKEQGSVADVSGKEKRSVTTAKPGRAQRIAVDPTRSHDHGGAGAKGPSGRDGRATGQRDVIRSRPDLERSQLAEYDFCTVELSNIPVETTRDLLQLVVESVFPEDGDTAIKEFNYAVGDQRGWIKLRRKEDAHELVLSSPLDVDGTPVHVVPLNTLLEDDPDYQGSAVVRVTNVPDGVSLQHIELLFKNKKSGGGPIEDVYRDEVTASVCITYKECCVAKAVLERHNKKPLQCKEQTLAIERLCPVPPPPLCLGPKECDRLLLTALPDSITGSDIAKFLNHDGDCDVSTILFSCKPGVALVIFVDFPDYEALLWRCGTRPLKDTMVSIQEIPLPRHIQVHGLQSLDTEMVELYFDSDTEVVISYTSPDKTWMIIQLPNPEAVKLTTKKQHKLDGVGMKVEVYYPDFGEYPPGVDMTQPLQERHATITVTTGGPVGRFIFKSPEAIDYVNDQLKPVNATVQLDSSSEEQLSLVCLSTVAASEMKLWKDTATNRFDDLLAGTFEARDLALDGELYQHVSRKAHKHARKHRLMITTDDARKTIALVGWKEEVRDAEASLTQQCQAIEDEKSADKCVIPVKRDEALLLGASDFSTTIANTFARLSVTIGEEMVILHGPTRYMSDAKVTMYEDYIRKKTSRDEVIPPDVLNLLQMDNAAKHVRAALADAELCVAWHVTDGKLTLIALNEDVLDTAMSVMKGSVASKKRELVPAELAAVQTQVWKGLIQSLEKQHEGLLVFNHGPEEVRWACVKDIAEDIDAEVNDYFVEFVIHEELVPADPGVVEVLDQYGDVRSVAKQANVKLESRWEDPQEAGFLIKGKRADLEAGRKRIKECISSVINKDLVLNAVQEIRFTKSQKCELTLETLRSMYRCAIRVVKEGGDPERAADEADNEDSLEDSSIASSGSGDEPTSRPNTLHTFTTKEGLHLSLSVGMLEKEKAQVLINTTQRDLNLQAGAVSAAILREAGQSVQRECNDKCPIGLRPGAILHTNPGRLQANYIFHGEFGVLTSRNISSNLKILKDMLRKCLDMADQKGQKSLATPAIGTGGFGLSRKDCAKVMNEVVQDFSKDNPKTSLKDIRIILHPKDKDLIKVFTEELQKFWGKLNVVKQKSKLKSAPVKAPDKTPELASGSTRQRKAEQPKPANFTRTPNTSDIVTTNGMTITQKKGAIEKETVDMIVNTTNCQLNLNAGGVSAVISNAAGPSVQAECQQKSPGGIREGDVITTGGGNLAAKRIIHGAAKAWDGAKGQSLQVLRDLMLNCLTEAMEKGLTSIAFPAIGTGNYGMPRDVVAKEMYEEILSFSERYPSAKLKDVRIMLHHSDPQTIQAFEAYVDILSKATPPPPLASNPVRKNRMLKPKSSFTPDVAKRQDFRKPRNKPNKRFPCDLVGDVLTVDFGRAKLQIYQGDLTKEAVDVIVNSTNEQLDLTLGAVSPAILRQGGKSIQEECQKIGRTNRDGLAITAAGTLPCRQILHLATGDLELSQLILKGLQEIDSTGVRSVAFPVLGTGNKGTSVEDFAKAFLGAVSQFLQAGTVRGTVQDIRLVVYQDKMVKELQDQLTKLASRKTTSSSKPSFVEIFTGFFSKKETTEVQESEDSGEDSPVDDESFVSVSMPPANDDVTLRLHGLSSQSLHRAIKSLYQHITSAMRTEVIGEEDQVALSNLTDLERSKLAEYDFCTVELSNIPVETTRDNLQLVVESVLPDADTAIKEFNYADGDQRGWIKFRRKEDANELVLSSPLDVDGTPVYVVPLNTLLEDDPDYQGSAAVRVTNIPDGVSPQHIQLLFKNKKSGGGPIEDVYIDEITSVVYITYEESCVAKAVLERHNKKPLQCKEQTLAMERLCPVPPPPLCLGPKECDRLLLTALPDSITGSDIAKFLNQDGDCDVSTILFSCKPGVALVIFVDFPSSSGYEALLWRCGTRPLKGTMVSIQEIPLPRHIQVHGLQSLNTEMVKQYFDSDTEVVSSYISPNKTWMIIQLPNPEDVERTTGREHKLDGVLMKVEVYYPDFGEYPLGMDMTQPPQARQAANAGTTSNLTDTLQPNWSPSSNPASVKRLSLRSKSAEYQQVERQFRVTVTTGTIQKIERIQNASLYKQYDIHKTRMDADNPTGHQNERILYHGTSAATVDHINRNGFDRRTFGQNYIYGTGAYFMPGADLAINSTLSPPDANGIQYIYQCKVLTGEYTQGAQGMTKPPQKPGKSAAVLYDSVVNDVATLSYFVIFNNNQAYPEYLIHYSQA